MKHMGLRWLAATAAVSPAPAGSKLAYITARNDVAEIVTMNLNGTEIGEVTTGADVNCVESDWSPSGSDLVFACDDESGAGRDVCLPEHPLRAAVSA
jgi:Tol biopolymer transport system component